MGKKLKKTMVIGGAAAAAYGFLPSQLGKLSHRLQQQAVRSVEALEGPDKVLYLTFDDGPHPICTAKLLDLLHQYNVKATFFVVGKFAEENPGLVVRMKDEGHVIGLHSYAHRSAMIQWAGSVRRDMDRCVRVLQDLGIQAKYYRPPWGHVNWFTLRQLQLRGLEKVLWDVMAEDWKSDTDEEEIQYKLLKRTQPGDIICLHDRQADGVPGESDRALQPLQMLAALEKTLPLWLEEGYRFEVIGGGSIAGSEK